MPWLVRFNVGANVQYLCESNAAPMLWTTEAAMGAAFDTRESAWRAVDQPYRNRTAVHIDVVDQAVAILTSIPVVR